MAWTSFDAEHPKLVGQLIENPLAAIPQFEARLPSASMSERLRVLGMLTSAYAKTGQKEKAFATIRQADAIPPKLAGSTAVADFTIYAAAFLARNEQEWDALARVNAALQDLTPRTPEPTTTWGRRARRQRQLIKADLRTTRATIHFDCFQNPKAAVHDAYEALCLIPSTHLLRTDARQMLNRSRLAALSILAVALASGAPIPEGLREPRGGARHRI
jgi:hypothetical protein